MKRITIIFACFFVFNCSNDNESLTTETLNNTNKIIVFGKKSDINKAIKNKTLKNLMQVNETIPLTEVTCYDNTGYNGNTGGSNDDDSGGGKPIPDGQDGNGNWYRSFSTFAGDMYISNDSDPDAIRRVELIGDVLCYDPYYSQNSYINVIVENSVNFNWVNAVNTAISEWNDAINNNPNNDGVASIFHPDSPHIYFRLANQANENDYANITIRMIPSSNFHNPNAVASARVGNYQLIANGVFRHFVGDDLRINEDFANYGSQFAITAMVHEIGHNLGFRHSNTNAPNIAGTSQNNQSVMNSHVQNGWNSQGFYSEDLLAIDRIFNVQTDWIILDCSDR